MTDSELPEVLPAAPEVYPVARWAEKPLLAEVPTGLALGRHPLAGAADFCLALGGWIWRWLVGAVMCFNAFVLTWFTAIAAVGWTNRVVQMIVLRSWWWRSARRSRGTFAQFCESLGPDGPVPRPRWFWQERLIADASRPRPGGGQPGPFTTLLRIASWPWYSLWLNFVLGFKATFCTYAILGLPCLCMLWSWEQGWLNSFNGGYEQAWFGPTMGITGFLLFIAAMYYVPMAQAHQAATGQARAFFDFHFVWLLVRARPTGYLLLALALGFWSLVLTIARNAVIAPSFSGNGAATAAEGLVSFQNYLLLLSLGMFPVYVILRIFGGLVYQSAVLKVLRGGEVPVAELHPVLRHWLDRLEISVVPVAQAAGITWYARISARYTYRKAVFTLLFLLWFAFIVRYYVGYFFVAEPYTAFLNHPMLQIPCFDFVPHHLRQGHDF